MAGVVLETLSNRKLITLGVILLLIEFVFMLTGGLVAPTPSQIQQITATKCLDTGKHIHKGIFYQRSTCESVDSLDDPAIEQNHIEANQIVFAMHIPYIRANKQLDMSRWFQNMVSILHFDVDYNEDYIEGSNPKMMMDVRLGYKDKGDANWTELARSSEERELRCDIIKTEKGYPMHCDALSFFELGSVHYDYYLVNIRIPIHESTETNLNLGSIRDVNLIVISQNGGFTKVWLSIKTIMFPALIGAMIWFWRRISLLNRQPVLLEKTLFALGLSLSFLNMPLEFLTLRFDMPYMLLLSDIRQGIFYASLLSFWIIFAGEHMMDQLERNRLVLYWKQLSAVGFACICLFVFDMCERGVQLTNPFYTIWVTQTGRNLGLAFIILAGIAACAYFIGLCYMIFCVFRNISAKKMLLPNMNKSRRKYFAGLIFRFKFLMLTTLLCAAMTVIFFIIGQVSESTWKWGEENSLSYTSAYFTGVYGMWNVYVFSLLCLYAPSHKYKQVASQEETTDGDEVIEFSNLPTESETTPTESSALAAYAKKAAAD